MFLGGTVVRYHIPGRESLIPGHYTVTRCEADGAVLSGADLARRLREGTVAVLDVTIER